MFSCGSKKRRAGAPADAGAKRGKAGVSKHEPITLEQVEGVVRAGAANVRSATPGDLQVKKLNQTGYIESILEMVAGYSTRGALDAQVATGCGMTYSELQNHLETEFEAAKLRPFYDEQWKREQGDILAIPPPPDYMCHSAHAFAYLLATVFVDAPAAADLATVHALRRDFSSFNADDVAALKAISDRINSSTNAECTRASWSAEVLQELSAVAASTSEKAVFKKLVLMGCDASLLAQQHGTNVTARMSGVFDLAVAKDRFVFLNGRLTVDLKVRSPTGGDDAARALDARMQMCRDRCLKIAEVERPLSVCSKAHKITIVREHVIRELVMYASKRFAHDGDPVAMLLAVAIELRDLGIGLAVRGGVTAREPLTRGEEQLAYWQTYDASGACLMLCAFTTDATHEKRLIEGLHAAGLGVLSSRSPPPALRSAPRCPCRRPRRPRGSAGAARP